MNSVVIFGSYIANSAAVRHVGEAQTPVVEFAIAVPSLKEGDKPTAVRVQLWGKNAEKTCHDVVTSSRDGLLIIGRTEVNSVDTPQGHKEQRAVFVASQVLFSHAQGTNVINLIGRLAAEPEPKFFESGSQITEFRIAVDRRSKQNNEPDWFSVEAWGKTAQVVADYCRKGSQIGITGSIKWDVWDDRTTGAKRSKPIIRVDSLTLLGGKRESQGEDSYSPAPASRPAKVATPAVEPDYDDIPF